MSSLASSSVAASNPTALLFVGVMIVSIRQPPSLGRSPASARATSTCVGSRRAPGSSAGAICFTEAKNKPRATSRAMMRKKNHSLKIGYRRQMSWVVVCLSIPCVVLAASCEADHAADGDGPGGGDATDHTGSHSGRGGGTATPMRAGEAGMGGDSASPDVGGFGGTAGSSGTAGETSGGGQSPTTTNNEGGDGATGGNAAGGNSAGGDSAVVEDSTPRAISVAAGNHFSCALLADRTVSCWGSSYLGELGSGALGPSTCVNNTAAIGCAKTPVKVSKLRDVEQISL